MTSFEKTLRTRLCGGLMATFAFCLAPSAVSAADAFDVASFGALPVQVGGRVQPVDTLARTGLLLMNGKETAAFSKIEARFWSLKPSLRSEADLAAFRAEGLPVDDKSVTDALEARPVDALKASQFDALKPYLMLPEGKSLQADVWLAEVAFRPWVARHFKVFKIDDNEVKTLLGLKPGNSKLFSMAEIEPGIAKIPDAAAKAFEKGSSVRTSFETGVLKLAGALERHHMLATATFVPGGNPPEIEPIQEYWAWLGTFSSIVEQLRKTKSDGAPGTFDETTGRNYGDLIRRYRDFMSEGKVGITPPRTADELKDAKWANLGGTLLNVTYGLPLDNPPVLPRYAELCSAYRKGDDSAANMKVRELAAVYTDGTAGYSASRVTGELMLNRQNPFGRGAALYQLAGLSVLVGWLATRRWPLKAAFWLISAGWLLHTAGLVTRIWIQGRPPVTNLYSSAVFVGWAAVLLGLILERIWKNGVGSAVSAFIGFATILIAPQLVSTGKEDTMQMLEAVLDSNFWLATHVVVIAFGYSAMFVAGFLAVAGLFRRVADRSFDEKSAHAVSRAAYGALCFAAVASFVGTMLGGIWADQSWGRFWGWDPKENGAILIVLWCALVLHARLGGLVKKVGFLQLLVIGNIVTAWSWLGTNMLGVGLHSYGFSDKMFLRLSAFVVSQVLIIALGWLPERRKVADVGSRPTR